MNTNKYDDHLEITSKKSYEDHFGTEEVLVNKKNAILLGAEVSNTNPWGQTSYPHFISVHLIAITSIAYMKGVMKHSINPLSINFS